MLSNYYGVDVKIDTKKKRVVRFKLKSSYYDVVVSVLKSAMGETLAQQAIDVLNLERM